MRRRFRFHRKKRGDRVSGSARLATLGEVGFFAASLLIGAVLLALIVTWIVIPQWRVDRYFIKTTCHVTVSPTTETRSDADGVLWQPTITYQYEVDGETYESSNYDLIDTRYSEQEEAEAIAAKYKLGHSYSCWYDPMEPGTAVLLRGNPLAYWLLLLPVAFLAIGIGGLGYSVWHYSVSRERRSVIAQRGPGKELFEEGADKSQFPAIPRDADVTNSPGTTLAFRLPISSTATWQLFATAVACLCWNSLVGLFVFLVIRKHLAGNTDWIFLSLLVPFAAAGIWLIVKLVRQVWQTSRIGPTRIEISEHPLRPGHQYELFITQTGNMKINYLNMKLVCEEKAIFRQGTDTIVDSQPVAIQPIMSESNLTIHPREPFEQRCMLLVPDGAMHSFRGIYNSIQWTLSVHADVERRGDYDREFSVIVVPANDARGLKL